MPGGDRTGPNGAGPMTGRRLGFCVGNEEPGAFYGQGYGFGRGAGMGYRHGFGGRFGGRRFMWQSTPVPQYEPGAVNEKKYLEREIEDLREHLSFLEEKLSKLKKNDG
ncbi:MAG: DUF5320 domain-containing protein [Bacteroidota bacterium]